MKSRCRSRASAASARTCPPDHTPNQSPSTRPARHEIVEQRPRHQRLEPRPHQHIGLEPARALLVFDPHGMVGIHGHLIIDIGLEANDLVAPFASTSMRIATNGASSTLMPHFSTGVTR